MKVYIILENKMIQAVTLSHEVAIKICPFAHLGLRIEEYETIEDEKLNEAASMTLEEKYKKLLEFVKEKALKECYSSISACWVSDEAEKMLKEIGEWETQS